MSIRFDVDCRDEKISGCNYWFSPEENQCGIMVFMDNVKIYLTSDQLEDILAEWRGNEREVRNKLSQHLLGHKEATNDTQTN